MADLGARFWMKTSVDAGGKITNGSECVLWTASKDTAGYGRFKVKGRAFAAHRIAYEALHGPIPKGLEIDHLCSTRNCVNRAHLEAVTHLENVRRGRSPIQMRGNTINQGERQWNAKLTDSKVAEIKRLRATGLHSQKAISQIFGIGPDQVSRIVNGKSWSHVHVTESI